MATTTTPTMSVAPTMTPDDRSRLSRQVRESLDGTPIAHLATVLPDGGPHSVPLWIGIHGDHVVFMTGPGSRKAINLRRDPRVALSLVAPDNPFAPMVLRGHVEAWLTGDDAWPIIDAISIKYTGAPYGRDQQRVVALVRVERESSR